MSSRRRHRHALHCIRRKLTNGSSFFYLSIFFYSCLRKNSRVPAELGGCASAAGLQLLCRVIHAEEETSPPRITCNDQLHASHLISASLFHSHHLSPSVCIFCETFSVFMTQSFVFVHDLSVSAGCFLTSFVK